MLLHSKLLNSSVFPSNSRRIPWGAATGHPASVKFIQRGNQCCVTQRSHGGRLHLLRYTLTPGGRQPRVPHPIRVLSPSIRAFQEYRGTYQRTHTHIHTYKFSFNFVLTRQNAAWFHWIPNISIPLTLALSHSSPFFFYHYFHFY